MCHSGVTQKVTVPRKEHEHKLTTNTVICTKILSSVLEGMDQCRLRKLPLELGCTHFHKALNDGKSALLSMDRVALEMVTDGLGYHTR